MSPNLENQSNQNNEKINKFVRYLNSKKLYILVVMYMFFKIGFRIGALAKIKVCDIMSNGIFIFRKKK